MAKKNELISGGSIKYWAKEIVNTTENKNGDYRFIAMVRKKLSVYRFIRYGLINYFAVASKLYREIKIQ